MSILSCLGVGVSCSQVTREILVCCPKVTMGTAGLFHLLPNSGGEIGGYIDR